jgi:hypothetical protein
MSRKPNQKTKRTLDGDSSSLTRRFIGGTVALFGVVVGLLAILPRVSVTPSDPVDPNNTFSASFVIANGTYVPLRNVTATLAIGQLQGLGKGPVDPNFHPNYTSRLGFPTWSNHMLAMDDKFTITPDDVIHAVSGSGVGDAEIAIVVSYQPWILPWDTREDISIQDASANQRQLLLVLGTNGMIFA